MVIRVGVIGLGYWGPNLLRNFLANDRFEVVCVADRNPDVGRDLTRGSTSFSVVADAKELIARDDVDAVAIATPVGTHYRLAAQALDAGKHVLVEKPICETSDEALDLVARAERVERTLMVDHTYLFTGAVQTIGNLIRSGQLGQICYFDSMRVNLGLFQPDVNCLWDLAPHDLSIIDYCIDREVADVEATGYCHVNPHLPDLVYMTVHYEGRTVAHFNLSWMSPVKVRRFAVGGTKQMLIWDDLDQDQKIKLYNSGISFQQEDQRRTIMPDYRIGDIWSPRVPRREALMGVVEHFGRVICGEEASLMDGYRGARIVRLLERAQSVLDSSLDRLTEIEGVRT
jgi:predicted dehydrogenase